MAAFDFLGETPAGLTDPAPTFNPGAEAAPGGFAQALSDPNVQRLLAQMGSGFSQGQPAGQAIGEPADALIRNKALQGAAAGGSGRQANFMQQLIRALQGDPLGGNLFGDKEDLNTLNSATIDNNGITIKAPNPLQTKPSFGTDSSLEAQPRSLETSPEPDAFPFL